jgi:S-adenosylmethionine uptake transporter
MSANVPHVTVDDGSDLAGIAAILAGMVAMSTNDMLVKFLGGGFPLHQIIFVRASTAILMTLLIIRAEGGFRNLRTQNGWIHAMRGALVIGANMSFFLGLFVLPLAEATALYFIAPLVMSLLAVPLLGEKLSLARLSAVLAGLAGVAIMVRPGGELFRLAALLPLASAFLYSMLQILTRRIGISEKASTMAFYTQASFIAFSAAFGLGFGDGHLQFEPGTSLDFLFRAWIWPDFQNGLLLLALGAVSAAVGYLLSQAYRLGRVSVVAPFEYVALPMAVFWGWLVWGDLPDAVSFLGIVLIVGAGLFMVLRENNQRRRRFAARSRGPIP